AFDELAKANKKASDSTKVLGKGVSKETKKTLGSYIKMSEGVKKEIDKIGLNGGKMSSKARKELAENIQKTGEEASKALKTALDKRAKSLNESTLMSKALTQEEKDRITNRFNERYDKETKQMEKLNAEIQELTQKQIQGKLTKEERKKLTDKIDEQQKLTVEYTAKSLQEQDKILSRLRNNRDAMGVKNASEAIIENAKAEKKALKEAKKIRDDALYEIDVQLENKDITKGEHSKLKKSIEKEYDDTVEASEKKSKELEKAIEKNNKDIWKDMDKEGHVYTGAEKMWKGFSDATDKWWKDEVDKTQKGWKILVDDLGSGWNTVVEWFSTTFTAENMNNMFASIGEFIAKPFIAIGRSVGDWWNQGVSETKISWSGFIQKLGSAYGSVAGWFVGLGHKMGGALRQGWNSMMIGVGPFFGSLWQTIQTGMATVKSILLILWQTITITVVNIVQGMGRGIGRVFGGIWSTAQNIFGTLRSWLTILWTSLKNTVVNLALGMWIGVRGRFINLWNTTKNIFTTLKGWLQTLWISLRNFVVGRAQSLWRGVSNAFVGLWNSTKSIFNTLKGW